MRVGREEEGGEEEEVFSGRVHNLSSPDTLCLTQTTFSRSRNIYIYLYKKIHMRIHIQIHIRTRSHISTPFLCL